jgi:hypothetical protein
MFTFSERRVAFLTTATIEPTPSRSFYSEHYWESSRADSNEQKYPPQSTFHSKCFYLAPIPYSLTSLALALESLMLPLFPDLTKAT